MARTIVSLFFFVPVSYLLVAPKTPENPLFDRTAVMIAQTETIARITHKSFFELLDSCASLAIERPTALMHCNSSDLITAMRA